MNTTEKQWDKDMASYKTLRSQGLQPRSIDGAHDLSQRATEKFEVESGHTLKSKADRDFARECLADMKASKA